jgi:hypothetical protein
VASRYERLMMAGVSGGGSEKSQVWTGAIGA